MASSVQGNIIKSAAPTPNICINFLNNQCPNNKVTCQEVHTKYPFLWQMEVREKWYNFPELHNKELELKYRVVSSDGSTLSGVDPVSGKEHFDQNKRWYADFDKMTLEGNDKCLKIRRLSRESRALNNDKFSTKYEWFFKDKTSCWILYGQSVLPLNRNKKTGVVSLHTTSSSNDIEHQVALNKLRVWSIQSAFHKYMLNFVNMTQTNQQTNVTRPIRRRPAAAAIISGSGSPSDYTTSPMSDDFAVNMNQGRVLAGFGLGNLSNMLTALSSELEKNFADNQQGTSRIRSGSNRSTVNYNAKIQKPMSKSAKDLNSGSAHLGAPTLFPTAYEDLFRAANGPRVKHGSGTARNDVSNFSGMEKVFGLATMTNLLLNANRNPTVINSTNRTQTNVNTGKVSETARTKQDVSMKAASSLSTTEKKHSSVPNEKKVFASLLKPSDSEYTKCFLLARKSSPKCNPKNIYKIHNPYLKAAFENKKAFMQQMYPDVAYKEELLFHGTKPANVQAILEENIDWRLHGTSTGQVYGRGAYFSNNAQLSLKYGNTLFICRVLVGVFTTGNSSTVRPAKNDKNQPYDTTVDKPQCPSIFVKYDTQEYYPEYYLEC